MGVQGKAKRRRSRAEWRRIFTRFKASGLSSGAFCRQEGIPKGSFARWRRHFETWEGETAAFVEFPPPAQPSSPLLQAGEMELVLPGGVRLHWKP